MKPNIVHNFGKYYDFCVFGFEVPGIIFDSYYISMGSAGSAVTATFCRLGAKMVGVARGETLPRLGAHRGYSASKCC